MRAKDAARLGEIAAELPPETELLPLNENEQPAWVWADTGLPLVICRHGNDAWTCGEAVCERRDALRDGLS